MHYENHHFPEFLAGPPHPPTGPEVGPWYDKCAPGCDDQLAVFSRVGRGLKGNGYRVVVKYDDKGETYLEGLIEDSATGEWTSDWVSENINGGYLTYQYHLHSWTNPKTFTITFTYTRPERSECEWTFTTPPIPYFSEDEITTAVDLDALAKVVGTSVEEIERILDDDFDPNDRSTYPLWIHDINGKDLLDLVLCLEDHLHRDLGFGGVSDNSDGRGLGILEGCNGNTPDVRDTIRDYIDGVRFDILGKLGLWENQEPYISHHGDIDAMRNTFTSQNNYLYPGFWLQYQYLPNPVSSGEYITSLKQWIDAHDNDLYAGLNQLSTAIDLKEPKTSGNYAFQYTGRHRAEQTQTYNTLEGKVMAHINDIHSMIRALLLVIIRLAAHVPQNTPGSGIGYDLFIDEGDEYQTIPTHTGSLDLSSDGDVSIAFGINGNIHAKGSN